MRWPRSLGEFLAVFSMYSWYWELPLEATGETGGHAGEAAEVAVEVALVGEADGQGNVGQRELRVAEHLLDVLEAATEEIPVRRHAERLLEGAGEMVG